MDWELSGPRTCGACSGTWSPSGRKGRHHAVHLHPPQSEQLSSTTVGHLVGHRKLSDSLVVNDGAFEKRECGASGVKAAVASITHQNERDVLFVDGICFVRVRLRTRRMFWYMVPSGRHE
jgi:hypothetical protein